jgi:hypothetical protein
LGGTLDLSSPPTIGNTTPNTGAFTTLTVNDNTTLGSSNTDTVNFNARINSNFDPATDNAYDLGRTGHEWRDLYINGTANIDSLIADTADINAGTIDNTSIGATTAASAKVTTLDITSTLALNGSTGTAGYVLTSNGVSAPTWQANANGITIADDTTTNATRYLTFSDLTTGTETTLDVSSTKLTFNPSTGAFTATSLTPTNALGAAYGGTGLTSLGSGVATWLGTPSSANLAAAVTDETGTGALVFANSPTLVTPALGTPSSGTLSGCTVDGTNAVGFRTIPQNSKSAAYTLVLADSGKHILHPSADTTARTFTIPANSSVAFPIGTAVTFINQNGAGVVTIAITTDTMRLSPAGTTGSRTLAANGIATAIKITSTEWIISGTGLT